MRQKHPDLQFLPLASFLWFFHSSGKVPTRFNGPHILTAPDGQTAPCCGDPNGCKWCAKGHIIEEENYIYER